MNKPFNLEEYKKNPSRLVHKNFPMEWHQLLPDDSIAVKPFGRDSFINRPAACTQYFELTPEYEVRRGRPFYDDEGRLRIAEDHGNRTIYPWCGPEFEYKVEV